MTSRRASQTAWVSGLELPFRAGTARCADRSSRRDDLCPDLPFFVIIADQMRQHLGIGAGPEFVSGLEQFLFERVVIFDDAIVDDGDFAGLIEMRMGIFVRRRPMRGPAGMSDAEGSGGWVGFQQRREAFVNPAPFLAHQQVGVACHGQARAVITAVFQPPQSFQQDGRGCFLADVTNDAAHKICSGAL